MRRLAAIEGWGVLEGDREFSCCVDGEVSAETTASATGASESAVAENCIDAEISASMHYDYCKPSAGAMQSALGILGALPLMFSAAFDVGSGNSKL